MESEKSQEVIEKPIGTKLEELEIELKQLEIKWSSGFRRIIDKFISPAMLGVIGILFGSVVTYQTWLGQQKKEEFIKLQQYLSSPPLAAMATTSLLQKGEEGYKALWYFLSSADSTSVDVQIRVFDIIYDICSKSSDYNAYQKLIYPLFLDESNQRRGKTDIASIRFMSHIIENINHLFYDKKLKIPELDHTWGQFHSWQKEWHQYLQEKENNIYAYEEKYIYVPAGYFMDTFGEVNYLEDYWAKYSFLTPPDSLELLNFLDKIITKLEVDPFNTKISQDIFAQLKNKISRYDIGNCFSMRPNPNFEDRFELEMEINFPYIFATTKRTNFSYTEEKMMKRKFENGIWGSQWADSPYIPYNFKKIVYVKWKSGSSEIIYSHLAHSGSGK